ncbi:hypothetical protein XA68_15299 [Ophiocordyceps unilateralis]|uniref:Uncharacterized protein n=1 Tax=Ophiocordyceps unilateralis TaxID=268505 RepID=A0A2A9P7H2_OPHUN|nr:hypothetical protein XA68_15299 [Ophiocordyceps unilateralis]
MPEAPSQSVDATVGRRTDDVIAACMTANSYPEPCREDPGQDLDVRLMHTSKRLGARGGEDADDGTGVADGSCQRD